MGIDSMPDATIQDYNNVHEQPEELFNVAVLKFRERMCDKRCTIEEIDRAFESLATDYLRCKGHAESQANILSALGTEWEMRKRHLVLQRNHNG